MHALLPFFYVTLAGCQVAPAQDVRVATRASSELFPPARQALTVPAEAGDVTLERLVRELERVSGARFVSGPHARDTLAQTPCGLHGPLEIAPADAWTTAEALLAHQGFVLVPLRGGAASIFGLESASGPVAATLRGRALQVEVERLESLAAHPALLVQATVDTSPLDARAFSHSMRPLIGDPSTEQMVPLGNTNRLLLLGRAPQVASWVRTIRAAAQAEPR